ncbi:uncharacterized protein LOC141594895 [Silene latifolia]|uniref:uncharacterized protein LOC141594895 n=1 Tax=Silene latifolia TaxID=37657 RepID=UPI003D76AD0D
MGSSQNFDSVSLDGTKLPWASWKTYSPNQNGSWAWRKLCKIKDILLPGFAGDWWLQGNQDYTISKGYNWLGPASEKVVWSTFVWVKEAIPRHSFIGWLVAQNRLLTRDRLNKMGIIEDETCPLCGTLPESHHHLFFNCIFSQKCLLLMSARLGCHLPSHDFIEWWISRRFRTPAQKNKIAETYLALIYAIWWNRNMGRLEGRVPALCDDPWHCGRSQNWN